jgi:hypothetical protein
MKTDFEMLDIVWIMENNKPTEKLVIGVSKEVYNLRKKEFENYIYLIDYYDDMANYYYNIITEDMRIKYKVGGPCKMYSSKKELLDSFYSYGEKR